jgi:hypothetical protein
MAIELFWYWISYVTNPFPRYSKVMGHVRGLKQLG